MSCLDTNVALNMKLKMCDIYLWRQWYIVATGLCSSISAGYLLGYPAVLMPAITSNNTDIMTTRDHASGITASIGVGGFFGAFIMSSILAFCGRKAAHIASNITHVVGWAILPFATNITALYAARIIQGLSFGAIYINCIIVGEYVHPSRRGYFITMKKAFTALGCLFCHAMGSFWTWRQISLFAILPPSMAIILTLFWPESPSYLALNGRYEESKKAFEWLNGDGEESKKHLQKLIQAQMRKSERTEKMNLLMMANKFLEKDFQKPILIVAVLTLALEFTGRHFFVAYITEILMTLLEDKTATIYFTLGADALTVFAYSSSILVIRYVNRRTLLFTSGFIILLLMMTAALLVYLETIFELPYEVRWLTALIFIFLSFVVNIGVIPVSYALISEIIPLEYKGLGLFVSGLLFTTLFGLTLKFTPLLVSQTGLHGTYMIYGICLGLCLTFLYKTVPETKDKSLQEIEDDNFRSIKGVEVMEFKERDRVKEGTVNQAFSEDPKI